MNLKEEVKSLESKLKNEKDTSDSYYKWWTQEKSKSQALCIVAKAMADSDGSVVQLIDRIAKAI